MIAYLNTHGKMIASGKSLYLIVSFLLFFIYVSSAQNTTTHSLNDTIPLEGSTITIMPLSESYLEATGSINRIRLDEIPAVVSINPEGLFNILPGVQLSAGTLNTSRLVIRGIGSRTPYGTNRIRAYLDDIPLTSGDGISNLEDIDMLSFSNLEVLKGPASALYGSGLGGIVRLNSPYPSEQGLNVSLFSKPGTFGENRYGASSSYKGGKLAFNLGYVNSSSEGFRENSTYNRENIFFSARYFLKKNSISFTLAHIDLYSEIPSSLNEEDFTNNPDIAGGNWGAINGYEEYSRLLTGFSLNSDVTSKIKNKLTLFSMVSDPYERRPFNILDEHSSSYGIREQLEYKHKRTKFLLGGEYFLERFNWKIYETLPEDQGSLISNNIESRKYLNGFLLTQWRPSKKVLIDAGLNMNMLTYSLNTLYNRDQVDQSGSYRYKAVFSPRIGISYKHNNSNWTYLSSGHGFSAPSLEETLLPEGIINTDLKPETGWNIEAGNRGTYFDTRLKYEFAVYSIFLKNLLVTERLEEDVFTGMNAGRARNAGMELLINSKLFPDNTDNFYNVGLISSFNLSRNIFTDFIDDGYDFSGNRLPGIPTNTWTNILNGNIRSIHLTLWHRYTGKQWMTDENDQMYNGYHLLNLHLSLLVKPGKTALSLKITGGIQNILNTQYASMILINAPSFGGQPARYYYPGKPRSLYAGVNLSYSLLGGYGSF